MCTKGAPDVINRDFLKRSSRSGACWGHEESNRLLVPHCRSTACIDGRLRRRRIRSRAERLVTAQRQPDFLTVEQAAQVIGLGRTKTYALARRAADFGEGPFPAIRLGKQLRIPRHKLEALSGGPIAIHTDDDITVASTSHDVPDPTNNTDPTPTTTTVDDTPADLQQPTLPFTE